MKFNLLIFSIFFSLFVAGQDKQYSVKDFGISGTEKMAVTQKFDKAIDQLCLTGGTLTIPAGKYILDNTHRIRKGVNGASYIFLANNNIKLVLDKEAQFIYKNGFRGFRFRTVKDPNESSPKKYSLQVTGGQIIAKDNWLPAVKNNPEIWGFVGEYFDRFLVSNLTVQSLYGTAGVAAYNCGYFECRNSKFYNVTGNPEDRVDNHGDGIYTANCGSYKIFNNILLNTIGPSQRIGRVGICVEYEGSGSGSIASNKVTGYDRAIHIELIKGTAEIRNNDLVDNSTGVALWNNYGYPQIIDNNTIVYKNLIKDNVPLLYTSAPILMLGANTNNGTQIINNRIQVGGTSFLPSNLLQVTSSNVNISRNTILDDTKTASLAIAQGKSANERVRNISFTQNIVSAGIATVYDATNVTIENNDFDLKEFTGSFDNSLNQYNSNRFNGPIKTKINLFGKYN